MTNQDAKGNKAHSQPIVYRIFLASPGDVRDERAFRGRVDLEIIAWDQPGAEVAMEAGLTPQEAIKRGLPKPSQCDLVIVILWSRMGTPLPAEYTKPGAIAYLSGTEWEYHDAINAREEFGKPTVWVYRRNQVPALNLEDPEFDEKRLQWQKVKDFFQTFVDEDGSLIGGVNTYLTPDEFSRQFEGHLQDRLTVVRDELFGPDISAAPTQIGKDEGLVLWTDAPYPGLETFKPEQAPIFFGRGSEVDQLLEVLRDPAIRFVAVVGASGSGKSSLVAAGLIPRLRAGALPGSSQWVDIIFKPGERGGDPFLALAYALKAVLGTTGRREVELAEELRLKPDSFATVVGQLLSDSSQVAEFLLVVDQFEEIFTLVADDARAAFIGFIERVVDMPQVRVLATIRADFAANVAEIPALAQLFQGKGIFLLAAPGVVALTEMIRRPAQMAGHEIRDDLCEQILQDTGTGAGPLALMAFALHEVYEHGKASGKFTLQDYESLKGVAGAIELQVERALSRLGSTDERALHALFSDLMEVNDQGVATRRRAALEQIRKDPAKKRLADALVEARILVTDKERAENPTIEVAHEAVFTGWRRLNRWIESNAGRLRVCRSLALVVIVVGILGVDIWLRSQEMNWNVLRIWALAQVGLYDGPEMVPIPPIPGTVTLGP